MRTSWMMSGLLAVMTLSPCVRGQNVLYHAIVAVPEAEVRAGASTDPRIYATKRLRQGDAVAVLAEMPNGWLKIQPPAGSFSWINTRFVKRVSETLPNNWMVVNLPEVGVPVYSGSEAQKQIRTIEGCKVLNGAQVLSVGEPMSDGDGSWLPIEPPYGEVRYVRAEMVTRTNAPPGTSTQMSRPGSTTALAMPGTTPEELWSRAQQAERAGKEMEAIQLYTMAAQEARTSQPGLAEQALERARWLQDARSNPTTTRTPTYPVSDPRSADAANSRFSPVPTHPASETPIVRLAPPCGSTTSADSNARPMQSAGGIYASGPGRLRRAGRAMDNRPTYVLEGGSSRMPLYVTPQPGIDLEPYVNHKVELYGPAVYNGDLRANYMAVSRVQPLPE